MRIRRALIIPAIVALGVAVSPLVGSAMPTVAVNVPVFHVHTTGHTVHIAMYHHG